MAVALPASPPVLYQPMKKWRIAVVLAVITVLVAGHAIDIYLLREHWPFSYYHMYARVEKRRTVGVFSLFGLMREPGYRALERITSARYVPPLSEGRLRVILMAAYRRGEDPKNIEDTKQVMADYMRLYESRRIAGLHDGPRMQEIHFYRLVWRLRGEQTYLSKPLVSEEILRMTWEDVHALDAPLPLDDFPEEDTEQQ